MTTTIRQFAAVLALLVVTGTANADNNLGIGVKAGTLGLGVEGTWRPLPWMDLRVGANAYDYDDTGSRVGIPYDSTLSLDTFYATGNFRFPLSPFRLTVGAYQNGNELQMVSQPSNSYEIGGIIYTPADVGTLNSVTSFEKTSPYLGVGYDFSLFGKVGMNIDFGLLWQGEPTVTLTADGLLATDPTFLAALESERLELEDEMSDFKAWPVVSIGFVFNFL